MSSSLSLSSLNPVQALVASHFFRKRHLLLMLPRQRGKTELGVRLMHSLLSASETRQGLFLAKNKNAGKRATREKFMRLFSSDEFVVNTDLVYNRACPTSVCYMDSVDKEPEKLRGGTFHMVHWTEVAFALFEKGLSVDQVLKLIILPTMDTTNGYTLLESTANGKNGWYDLWENAENLGFTKIKIPFTRLVDMGLETEARLRELQRIYCELEFLQEYECEFVTFQGAMYTEMQAHHVWEDMPPPKPWQKVIMAIDWGWKPSATCVLFAYLVDGRLCIFDEIYGLEMRLDEVQAEIKKKFTEYDISSFAAVADHEPRSIEELNLAGIPCGLAKKVDVKGTRLQIKTKFKRDEIYIHPRCTMLRKDLSASLWDPKHPGEILESACTWGHFDCESTLRYLVRELEGAEMEAPVTNPHTYDTLSQAAWNISRIREEDR